MFVKYLEILMGKQCYINVDYMIAYLPYSYFSISSLNSVDWFPNMITLQMFSCLA